MTAIVNVAVSAATVGEDGATNLTCIFTRNGDTSLALTVKVDLTGITVALGFINDASRYAWTCLPMIGQN